MHILGGKLKGKKLANCKTSLIRPAMALVRKSIFDTLRDFVVDANVLDLCAGSGALGIEALSRGSKNLIFVDANINAIKLIRENLALCNITGMVLFGRVEAILNKPKIKSQQFDLIFLDPPYGKSKFISNTLLTISKNNLLSSNGLLLIESELKSDFTFPEKLKLYKEKRFGNTKITILRSET